MRPRLRTTSSWPRCSASTTLSLIRNGRAGTLLRWVWTLPDAQIARHPDVALAAAVAATMVGRLTLQRRRLLALAEQARVEHPEAFGQYEASVMAMARAAGMDNGVSDAVQHGHQAVQLAREGADEVLVAAYAALARALYFSGDLDGAWAAASRAAEHPRAACARQAIRWRGPRWPWLPPTAVT